MNSANILVKIFYNNGQIFDSNRCSVGNAPETFRFYLPKSCYVLLQNYKRCHIAPHW